MLKEKDSQIEELKKATNLFNFDKPENIALLTEICRFASDCHAYQRVQRQLSENELNFCFRFIHREIQT